MSARLLRRESPHMRAGSLHARGLEARARGRADWALTLLRRAAEAEPERADILCDLGNALKAMGRHAEAVACHEAVVALAPDAAPAYANLGAALNAAGDHDAAIACYQRALARWPQQAELHYNLGGALAAARRFADAEAAYRAALDRNPDHLRAYVNLGAVLRDQGKLNEAIAALRVAVARAPADADAHWNLALALLTAGDDAGWAEYEWRRRIPDFAMPRLPMPAWDGAPLAGRRLLVHAEQGLGDTLQFARYAALIDGDAILACQKPLAPLLGAALAPLRVIALDEKIRCDVQTSLLSLPHRLKCAAPTAPYLRPDPARVARWRERLGAAGLRIGIAWQGNPAYPADWRRSAPLAAFAPLAALPNVRLISLQKDADSAAPFALTVFPDLDRDAAFADSAAIIASLDAVVATDSAIAHLAGALGARTCLALADVPDWRWGLAGEVTPWYGTMRLYRQPSPGDWGAVFAAIAASFS